MNTQPLYETADEMPAPRLEDDREAWERYLADLDAATAHYEEYENQREREDEQ